MQPGGSTDLAITIETDMILKKTLFHLSFAALAASLAACGAREPSQSDMFEALAGNTMTRELFGSLATMEKEAKKAGCEKQGERTFKCGVADKDGKGMVMNFSFVQVDGKWQLTN